MAAESNTRRSVTFQHLRHALMGVLVAVTAGLSFTAVADETLTVTVTRRDLRPLPGVTLQLTGAVSLDEVTDDSGRAAFPGLPPAGGVTITPSRSGFRFQPPHITIPDPAHPTAAGFTAYPSATDLALSMTTDDTAPLVGGLVNGVITLSNQGTEAATDVAVGFGSLPGLALENRQATEGVVETRAFATLWRLPQLHPGASAELRVRCRATLPDASILAVAVIEEMDQTDTTPLNNSALLTTQPRAAEARLLLSMTPPPPTAKAGEILPVQLTVRNDGPHEATQIAVRTYLPPGASFVTSTNQPRWVSRVVIPRLAAGAQVQLNGGMLVRFAGTYTLIANVTDFEQQLPTGAAWPEARSAFTVQPAYSRLTLLAFTDPPNPRVGETVNVTYVARNDGPDPVTGLQLFMREDPRLDLSASVDPNLPPPPVPGPLVFGDVLPVGAHTYLRFGYTVRTAGDHTNYFTVQHQDQSIPDAADHPELFIPITSLPADVGLSLDANPKDLTAVSGEPVTMEFRVHNDGPQPARGIIVDYDSPGLTLTDLDEVIHADRVLRPGFEGFIDVVEPGETVRLRRHFVASAPGAHTNSAEITTPAERPDLLRPIAREPIRLQVLPGPPPDLGISVNVEKPEVHVGEYAIFIVTITNRTTQPALSVMVRETDAADVNFAFETVRSHGPHGDDRINPASRRMIPRIEPGASYSMSRTMRVRQPVTIPYLAAIEGVNGLPESELPVWRATTEVTGVQVASDVAPEVVPDRTNVKNGDLVNFAIISRNVSSRTASHVGITAGGSAGFQVLGSELGAYGYFFDYARPNDLPGGMKPFAEWPRIGPQEAMYSWLSTYAVGEGQLTVGARLAYLDQSDADGSNDLALVQIHSAAASADISLRQSVFPADSRVGDFVLFVTEIRNEGPDRVTGLSLAETSSANLEPSLMAEVNGISGDLVTSFLDPLVRLPALEPGQNFVWQRTHLARAPGNAWRRVRVARLDQTARAPLPESEAALTVQPAHADLELKLLVTPTGAETGIPTPVVARVRNLGPSVATGVRVAVTVSSDALTLGVLQPGPRASYDWLALNTFQTNLRPGESATATFSVTPTRAGIADGWVSVQQSDQIDPDPANNTASFALNVGPAPPIPPILRVRKVRTDFFDHTPIAEIEIDQAALNRLAPLTLFQLEGTSNLRDWEFLTYAGFLSLAPVTFTDHADPGETLRIYRLRAF